MSSSQQLTLTERGAQRANSRRERPPKSSSTGTEFSLSGNDKGDVLEQYGGGPAEKTIDTFAREIGDRSRADTGQASSGGETANAGAVGCRRLQGEFGTLHPLSSSLLTPNLALSLGSSRRPL